MVKDWGHDAGLEPLWRWQQLWLCPQAQNQPCPFSLAEPVGPGAELQLGAGGGCSLPQLHPCPGQGTLWSTVPLWSHSSMSPWPGTLQRAAKFTQKFTSASFRACTEGNCLDSRLLGNGIPWDSVEFRLSWFQQPLGAKAAFRAPSKERAQGAVAVLDPPAVAPALPAHSTEKCFPLQISPHAEREG